jgi:predicted RNA-binding Zn-ribbon protein involved in translation (DUF1610 family)
MRDIESITQRDRWRCPACGEDWPPFIIECLRCRTIAPGDDRAVVFAEPRFGISFSHGTEERFATTGRAACYAECRVGGVLGMASISVGGWVPPHDRKLREWLGIVMRLLALEGALGRVPAELSPRVQAIVDRTLLIIDAWITLNEPATALRLRGYGAAK